MFQEPSRANHLISTEFQSIVQTDRQKVLCEAWKVHCFLSFFPPTTVEQLWKAAQFARLLAYINNIAARDINTCVGILSSSSSKVHAILHPHVNEVCWPHFIISRRLNSFFPSTDIFFPKQRFSPVSYIAYLSGQRNLFSKLPTKKIIEIRPAKSIFELHSRFFR